MKHFLQAIEKILIFTALTSSLALADVKKFDNILYYPVGSSGGYTIIQLDERNTTVNPICFKSSSTGDAAKNYAAFAAASVNKPWFGIYDLSQLMTRQINGSGECTYMSINSRYAAEYGF